MTGRPSHLNTRYKFELTPRQREVMDLIAAGRTNGEIAETLGITLEGAKYHVSEIIAKLNVDTREEAAMAWRREQSPARRFASAARGFAGFAGLKWLAVGVGGAGAAALGAVVLVAVLGSGGAPGPNSAAMDQTPPPARPCQQVTDELESVQSWSGAWIFRVQVVAADAPCYLKGDVSLVADDSTNAIAAAQSPNPFPPANRLPLAADAPIDQLVQTSNQFVAQFEWTNWCGPSRAVYFNADVSAVNQKESFAAQTVLDQVPSCAMPHTSTVALTSPVEVAERAVTAAVLPKCVVSTDSTADSVEMQLWTAAPWGPGRAAGFSVDLDPTSRRRAVSTTLSR